MPLRALSLNLHTYQEDDALAKLLHVAEFAAGNEVDVLLLQEVGEHLVDSDRPNAGGLIADHLARLTSFDWHHEWAEAHTGFDVYREGVSIISRHRLSNPEVIELSAGALRRIALMAAIEMDGKPIRLVTVHVTWPEGGGAVEVQRLLAALESVPSSSALLIGGDFNASPPMPHMRQITLEGYIDLAEATASPFLTIGNPPNRRIDYLFHRDGGATALVPRCLTPVFDQWRVSDHVGLLGEYGVKDPGH